MSATDLARLHLDAALTEAKSKHVASEAVLRAMLGLVIGEYLETRAVHDVQSELRFAADNCDPDTDHAFMRP
ncbi:MAG: hypothetical protein AB1342_05935 [Pseudomonadota bacterium]